MKIDLNKTISFTIIIAGYLFFLLNVSEHYPMAFIALIGTMFIWMIWAKLTKLFTLDFLLYLIFISGLFSSISILAIHGVEPIGTRHGVLFDFHLTAIAIALGVLFITSLPYIVFRLKISLPIKKLNVQLSPAFNRTTINNQPTKKEPSYIIDSDEWEIASDNDITSY